MSCLIFVLAFAIYPSACTKTLLPAARYSSSIHLWKRYYEDRPHEGLSVQEYARQYHDAQAEREPVSAKISKFAKTCLGGLCGGRRPEKDDSKPEQAEHASKEQQHEESKGQAPKSTATQSRTGTLSHAGSSDVNSRTKLLTSGSSVDWSSKSRQRKQQQEKPLLDLLHSKETGRNNQHAWASSLQKMKVSGVTLSRQKGFRAESLTHQTQIGRQHGSIEQNGLLAKHIGGIVRQEVSGKSPIAHEKTDLFRRPPNGHAVHVSHVVKSPFEQSAVNHRSQTPTKRLDQQRKKLSFISLISPKRLPKGLKRGKKSRGKEEMDPSGGGATTNQHQNHEERSKQRSIGRHDVSHRDTLEKIEEEDGQVSRPPSFTTQRSQYSRQRSGISTYSKETLGGSIAPSFRSRFSIQEPKSPKTKVDPPSRHHRTPWLGFLRSKGNTVHSGQDISFHQLSKSSKHTDGTDSSMPEGSKSQTKTGTQGSITQASKPLSFKAWGPATHHSSSAPTSPPPDGFLLGHDTPAAQDKHDSSVRHIESTGEAEEHKPNSARHSISSGEANKERDRPQSKKDRNVDEQFRKLQDQLKWGEPREEGKEVSAAHAVKSRINPSYKSPFDFRDPEHQEYLMPFVAHKRFDPKSSRKSQDMDKITHDSDRSSHDVDRSSHGSTKSSHGSTKSSHGSTKSSHDTEKSSHASTQSSYDADRSNHGSI